MQVVTEEFVKNKKVLLRYDIDVALGKGTGDRLQATEDFKLRVGLETLKLCIDNAAKVVIIGHLGRPFKTVEDEKIGKPSELSAKPIQEWLQNTLREKVDFAENLEQAANSTNKLVLLENIRFFHGEVPGSEYHATCTSKSCDIDFAHKLAALGDVYVNEAFSSYNPAASTTMLPTLLPHAAGLHFAQEVRVLREVRNPPAGGPKKPFVVIMGGAKVTDKLPVIQVLAEKADAVLVGGKLIHELRAGPVSSISHRASSLANRSLRLRAGTPFSLPPALPRNVLVGKLNEDGFDIAPETVEAWKALISKAAMIVWNGPLGQFEDPKNDQSAKVAELVIESGAEIVVGGGDTVSLLGSLGLLGEFEKKGFVSVGGGAMLKFLSDGTLPTIDALV